jgi:hypothetical protein
VGDKLFNSISSEETNNDIDSADLENVVDVHG